ncbi:hypothetical protein DFJ77DRAFT_113245 [Powellomyces hirtus]|nr:hypothetical protein DFJ77DRAFT_113245 [Powellomyces hirtus]
MSVILRALQITQAERSRKIVSVKPWKMSTNRGPSPKLTKYVKHILIDMHGYSAAISEHILDLLALDNVHTVDDLIGCWACLATHTQRFMFYDEAVRSPMFAKPMKVLLRSCQNNRPVDLDLAVYIHYILSEVISSARAKRDISALTGLLGAHGIKSMSNLAQILTTANSRTAAQEVVNSMWFRQVLTAGLGETLMLLWGAAEQQLYFSLTSNPVNNLGVRASVKWSQMRKLRKVGSSYNIHNTCDWM